MTGDRLIRILQHVISGIVVAVVGVAVAVV